MKPVAISLCILLLLFNSSCNKWGVCKDEDLDYARRDNTANTIRLNGYYYSFSGHNQSEGDSYGVHFLHTNGSIYSTGLTGSLDTFDQKLATQRYKIHDPKSCWGVYFITHDTLKVSQWVPGMCGYPSREWEARVINDSTLVLLNSIVDTLHFHACIKPDSTNDFIH